MKRKCKYCGTEFEFKVKDLLEYGEDHYSKLYNVICPYCLTPKRVMYNHKPRHLKKK